MQSSAALLLHFPISKAYPWFMMTRTTSALRENKNEDHPSISLYAQESEDRFTGSSIIYIPFKETDLYPWYYFGTGVPDSHGVYEKLTEMESQLHESSFHAMLQRTFAND